VGPTTETAPAVSKNVFARLVSVIFSPRATYADIAAKPRVLGALAIVILIAGSALFTFMSTDVGKQAWLDAGVRQAESYSKQPISDAQYQRMEQLAPYAAYISLATQVIGLPLMALIVAGIAFAVFNAALGGDATFKQVYAIVAHSGVILIAQSIFSLPIAYARETLTGATNLAVFFPFLDENSFAARLLGSIDLILIWWIMSVSIGLGVLYRKRTGPIATTMLIVYVLIGLVIAAIKSMASGA
jgi:hypothetical protein